MPDDTDEQFDRGIELLRDCADPRHQWEDPDGEPLSDAAKAVLSRLSALQARNAELEQHVQQLVRDWINRAEAMKDPMTDYERGRFNGFQLAANELAAALSQEPTRQGEG